MTAASALLLVAALQGVPEVHAYPQPAAQGDIVVLEVPRAAAPGPPEFELGTARRDAAGVPHRFFASGDRYLALVGVDAEAQPGRLPLVVYWADEEKPLSLQVRTKKFPTERLTVEPKYVEPPPEVTARIVEEKERLDRIWRRPSDERFWQRPFVRPVAGLPNSAFGLQRILNGQRRSPHNGVDFPAGAGVPVSTANTGEVVVAESLYFTGNTVVVDHGLGLYTTYAHLSEITVHVGQSVPCGAILGRVGSTGRATGPHLHWGARLLEARVDPMQLLQIDKEASHGSGGR